MVDYYSGATNKELRRHVLHLLWLESGYSNKPLYVVERLEQFILKHLDKSIIVRHTRRYRKFKPNTFLPLSKQVGGKWVLFEIRAVDGTEVYKDFEKPWCVIDAYAIDRNSKITVDILRGI